MFPDNDDFCHGIAFWNESLLLDNWYPEFTSCFQETALTFVPCGFLWLSSLVLLAYLKGHTKYVVLSWNWRSLSRVICALVLSVLALLHLTLGDEETEHEGMMASPAFYVSKAVWGVTFLYAIVLMGLCQRSGVTSPCIIFIFWIIAIVAHVVPVYTSILKKSYEEHLRSFTLVCCELAALVFGMAFLWIGDSDVVLTKPSITGTPCPSVSASYVSRLTYAWVFSMVYSGYKKPVTADCEFDLPPHMQCRNIYPGFIKSWTKELTRSRAVNRTQEKGSRHIYTNGATSLLGSVQKGDEVEHNEKTPLLSKMKIDGEKEEEVQAKWPQKKPSLYKVLFKVFYLSLFKSQMVGLMADMLQFVNPLLLKAMINFAENKESYPQWQGYVMAGSLFLVTLSISVMTNFRFYTAWNIGTQIKTVVTAAVYKKAMTMNAEGRRQFTVGTMVNLMAVDCPRFQDVSLQMYVIWSFPIQMSLAMYMIYDCLGLAFVACLGLLLLLIPINAKITTLTKRAQDKQITIKDTRIKLMNEILNGIRVLKLYAWERSFEDKIGDVRKLEVLQLKWAAIYQSLSVLCWLLSPVMVTLTAFIAYVVISGDSLTPTKAFVAMSVLNIIRQPMMALPQLVAAAVQCHVSMERIRNYLAGEDLEEPDPTVASPEYPLTMESGTFCWDRYLPPTLKNVNVRVGQGQLVAVVGAVGSGKSSLLSAFLGEMERLRGRAGVKGTVAYVPQQAWIQNLTLRDNILFEKPMNQAWYKKCIQACALGPDIELLPGGEMTEIGEKGINLSGGQKQRISLTRAVYQQSDVYLLDDPLSAVDAHVGKHIFDNVIGPQGVLKNKTRLLVSHGLHWLPRVDSIIVLDDGCVTETGSFDQLMDHDGPFAQFIRTYLLEHQGEEIDDPEELMVREKILDKVEAITSDDEQGQISLRRSVSVLSDTVKSNKTASTESLNKPNEASRSAAEVSGKRDQAGRQLIKEERQERGKVRLSVFIAILKAFGYLPASTIPFFLVVFIGFNVGTGIWLSKWTDDPYLRNETNVGTARYMDDTYYYLGLYIFFSLMQIVGNSAYILVLVIQFVNASRRMHNKMLKTILHQPMAFFDTTPLGRVLNRFSADVDQMDSAMSRLMRMVLQAFCNIIAILIVISYTAPIFLAVVIPMAFIYYLAQKFYMPSSRQFRRLESVTRSPIFSHFAESISGASSIRSYKVTERFSLDSQKRVDTNNFWFYITSSAMRWLRIRLEILGNCIVLFAGLFAVISDGISGSLVGLSITYALQVTGTLNVMIQNWTQLETRSVSAERILEYSELPYEPDWVVDSSRPPLDWPERGEIRFKHYSTRYRPGLDLVLNDLDFTVKPGEKVGVVGRTGAGKSSMSMALFRVIEAAAGRIVIDGVDISSIGLHDLRDRLTILPQDPVLFSSTLRFNLDPFDMHSDVEIWEALRHAHLVEYVMGLPAGLEHICEEGGQNLSVGQRQLVCLARALLRNSQVLVLDEATAAVDLETDALLQAAIRTALDNRTLITVAHRLQTIIDYDRILVLHEGRIKEYDTPKNLLDNKNSIFYGMAKESGLV
ncbi:canalicular multispecific organic anion transporter 2 [Aplysia californica]|uniref:ABC-type glutathione-S-conjugate transporter n=1 Tax=Aplysia californica TaxID=6500 RepID=A0ABM0JEK4_APLCA|nr:canalicular multispecific organic anion transporter 2 [Aplysia californica]